MNIVLAIADDRAICESLRAALPKTDLILFEDSVESAQRRLISVQVDAIILDDAAHLGLNALRALVEGVPATPVIVLSSRGDPESLASYTMAGARTCIVKPFQCEVLTEAINECLNRAVVPNEAPVALAPDTVRGASVNQHQMAMRWMSRASALMEDPARLTQSLVDASVDIFDSVRSAVLLQSNGAVRCVASIGIPPTVVNPIRLTFSGGLMRWLEENTCLFDRVLNRDAQDAVKEMAVLGGRLSVPLVSGGRTCGAIVLGEKASGLDYSLEERDLLTIMARCASSYLEKARHYRDMARQQSRLDAVLANITAGVVTVRPDKTISMMNESAERILQIRAVDLLGRSVQKLGSGFADAVLRTLREGKPRLRHEIRDVAINARLGLSVTPLGAEGAVAIFSILPDEASQEENIAYSPIWEFLASRVAQEIKNPMVAVNTFAQLLPRKHDSEEFREDFAEVVQKEVSRINDVVETLFEFARHPRLSLHSSDLNKTVEQVLSSFQEELDTRSIAVQTDFDESAVDVAIDPELFTKAVRNVVRNSIEAMEDGGTLRIRTKRNNGVCELVVEDTGPGVSEHDAPLVFQPFYSTKERGMGLGLTMANRIMEQHEGLLELLRTDTGGGAFAFRLPSVRGQRSSEKNAD